MTARPPTTPPTIGPTCVPPLLEADEDDFTSVTRKKDTNDARCHDRSGLNGGLEATIAVDVGEGVIFTKEFEGTEAAGQSVVGVFSELFLSFK